MSIHSGEARDLMTYINTLKLAIFLSLIRLNDFYNGMTKTVNPHNQTETGRLL